MTNEQHKNEDDYNYWCQKCGSELGKYQHKIHIKDGMRDIPVGFTNYCPACGYEKTIFPGMLYAVLFGTPFLLLYEITQTSIFALIGVILFFGLFFGSTTIGKELGKHGHLETWQVEQFK